MKALVFNQDRMLQMREVSRPQIKKDRDVLVNIRATGICGTDVHILSGHYLARPGIILGHESSGIVEEIGSQVKNVKIGDRVIIDPTYHCNECSYCVNNKPNYCAEKNSTETGVSSDGTFAEYHLAHSSFIYPLPEKISFETATLTEPLACVLNALRQTRISHESKVLIVGAGPIGLLFGLATSSFGCETTIGDISDYRVSHAESLSLEVQNYRKRSLLEENTKRKFDIAVDTSGKSLESLLPLVDKGGDLLTVGLDYNAKFEIKPAYLTDNGIRIIGSIDSNSTFAPAINMIKNNPIFSKIITHRMPIEEYEKAFQILGVDIKNPSQRGGISAGKVIIYPN